METKRPVVVNNGIAIGCRPSGDRVILLPIRRPSADARRDESTRRGWETRSAHGVRRSRSVLGCAGDSADGQTDQKQRTGPITNGWAVQWPAPGLAPVELQQQYAELVRWHDRALVPPPSPSTGQSTQ